MPLDATPGGASANAYVDQTGATAYFAARRNVGAWTAAISGDKDVALMAATARLEQESYEGRKASTTQALKWPRVCAYDDDGDEYSKTAIPRPVIVACCELALHLLNSGITDPLVPTGLEQFQAVSVGALDVTPNSNAPSAGALPPQVTRALRGLRTSSATSVHVARG